MIVRLAFKNMKKSMSDDVVYFVTLVLGICMYYVFAVVQEQPAVQEALEEGLSAVYVYVRYLNFLLPVVRFVVLAVFVGLIVYANRFRMNRRKREFGLYLLLGMKKRTIAGILFVETVFIGSVSLILGIVLGIFVSQGTGVLVADFFEEDLSQFSFVMSGKAFADTLFSFWGIYVLVYGINMLAACRMRLIRLFQAGRRQEESRVRPVLCFFVFMAAAVMLGRVYYMVTIRLEQLLTPQQAYMQLGMLFAGTGMVFWSLSGLLLFAARVHKRFYLRGIRAFTVREISSRFHTNILAGSIICFLMFLAMSIGSSSFSLCQKLNENMKTMVPADVCFEMSCCEKGGLPFDAGIMSIGEWFDRQGIDTGMFRDAVEVTVYEYYEWNEQEQMRYSDNFMLFAGSEIMKLSDYNKVARLYGKKTHTLSENEYFVVSNKEAHKQWCNRYHLAKNQVITFGGTDYFPRYTECQEGFLRPSYIPDNFGITVVPDSVAPDENLHPERVYYIANYRAADTEDARRIDTYVKGKGFLEKMRAGGGWQKSFFGIYGSDICRDGFGIAILTVFLGLYIGILFVMISAALFSLKELTQAVDSRDKYRTLWRLGVSPKMIRRSLLFQNALFFSIPFVFATLHFTFGSRAVTRLLSAVTEMGMDEADLSWSVWGTTGVLAFVYLLYFVITYRGSRKVIE